MDYQKNNERAITTSKATSPSFSIGMVWCLKGKLVALINSSEQAALA